MRALIGQLTLIVRAFRRQKSMRFQRASGPLSSIRCHGVSEHTGLCRIFRGQRWITRRLLNGHL